MFTLQNPTEQVGSSGTTAHFYSRDTWFKTELGHQLFKLVLWISLVAAAKCQSSTLNYITASSFHIISNSSHVMAHVVSCPYHGGPGSFLDHPMQDLWWKEWHWNRFFSKYYSSCQSVSLHQCSAPTHSSTTDTIHLSN